MSDGVEGFGSDPCSCSCSSRRDLALWLALYQDYVGAVAQHVAVDTEAAAAIIRLLVLSLGEW